ncbi:hypothetical protein E2C01_012160 [Portunus trituberculatus]|uniref:Uncharacterized protein n=1 Tax=Portunus trituberculatus TaxID=210409 RepID=A0A5B7DD73_PORTR|nr:hypothetical protein [Portunus trituberculatus]
MTQPCTSQGLLAQQKQPQHYNKRNPSIIIKQLHTIIPGQSLRMIHNTTEAENSNKHHQNTREKTKVLPHRRGDGGGCKQTQSAILIIYLQLGIAVVFTADAVIRYSAVLHLPSEKPQTHQHHRAKEDITFSFTVCYAQTAECPLFFTSHGPRPASLSSSRLRHLFRLFIY